MSATAPINVALPPAPPMPSVDGGGGQTPMQMPTQGGGAAGSPVQSPMQSPMQVPVQQSAVQGAAGGGQLVQNPAPAAPAAAAPAPAPAAQPAPPVQGGGGAVDMNAILPILQQLVTVLTSLVTTLQQQMPAAQAQAGAAGVQAAAGIAPAATTPAGTTGTTTGTTTTAPSSDVAAASGAGSADPAVTGGGAPGQAPAGGCGCGCGMGEAKAAGESVQQSPDQTPPSKGGGKGKGKGNGSGNTEQLPPAPPLPGTGGDGRINQSHTVKGTKMDAEQVALAERVLKVGQGMGANRKVLEAAVSTMIQESTLRNLKHGDRDSQGLFQQRPSQGWGTVAQVTDPEHAAKKFFERAIANDKKKPDMSKTQLAQSVQISGFPNAYAQWDKEAASIVGDYLS